MKIYPCSATEQTFPGMHYQKNRIHLFILHNVDCIKFVFAEVWKNMCHLELAYQSCQSDPQESINLQLVQLFKNSSITSFSAATLKTLEM